MLGNVDKKVSHQKKSNCFNNDSWVCLEVICENLMVRSLYLARGFGDSFEGKQTMSSHVRVKLLLKLMIITHIAACLITILFSSPLRSTPTTFVQLPKITWFVVKPVRNQWPDRWQRDSPDQFSAWALFTTCPQQRAAHSSRAITSQTSSHGAGESAMLWSIDLPRHVVS